MEGSYPSAEKQSVYSTAPANWARGHVLKQLWLFGGIKRLSKQRFAVTLNGPTGDKRNSVSLLPLTEKYIKPGSIIYSDIWTVYKSISSLGLRYKHFVINYSENFVTSEEIHTETIERLWRDLKEWIKQPDINSKYMHQYLARYLFVSSVSGKTTLVHQFFIQAARLYPLYQTVSIILCHNQ